MAITSASAPTYENQRELMLRSPLYFRNSHPSGASPREQRIIHLTAGLKAGLKESKSLSLYALQQIATFIENYFAKQPHSHQIEYVSILSSRLPRALVLDCAKWFGVATPLENSFVQGQANDLFALGCSLYLMLFPHHLRLPWGYEVDHAILKPSEQTMSAATKKYMDSIEALSQQQAQETNQECQQLLCTCLNLLSADPRTRLTFLEEL
jgi:hypothetical protein